MSILATLILSFVIVYASSANISMRASPSSTKNDSNRAYGNFARGVAASRNFARAI